MINFAAARKFTWKVLLDLYRLIVPLYQDLESSGWRLSREHTARLLLFLYVVANLFGIAPSWADPSSTLEGLSDNIHTFAEAALELVYVVLALLGVEGMAKRRRVEDEGRAVRAAVARTRKVVS